MKLRTAMMASSLCTVATLAGCVTNLLVQPQYLHTRPAAPQRRAPVDIESVRFRVPALGLADASALTGATPDLEHPRDFQLLLDEVTAAPRPSSWQVLGALRTSDRVLDLVRYRALDCSFAISVPTNEQRMGLPMSAWFEPMPPQCPDIDVGVARLLSSSVLEELLTELRERSARIGANMVDELRCFAMHDLLRVFCEGVAVRTPDADAALEQGPIAIESPSPVPVAVRASSTERPTTSEVATVHTNAPSQQASTAVNTSTVSASAVTSSTPVRSAVDPQPASTGPLRVALETRIEAPATITPLPDEDGLREAVRSRLRRDPFDPTARVRAVVVFLRVGDRWQSRIEFVRDGRTISVRTLRAPRSDVRSILNATALSMSLALGH